MSQQDPTASGPAHVKRPSRLPFILTIIICCMAATSVYLWGRGSNAADRPVKVAVVTWNNDAFWDPVIRGAEEAGGAADDQLQFLDRVEIEADRDSEPVTQRRRQQPLAGRCTDQGEARQVDADRAGRRALADHQVEGAVLHRRIKHFLDRRIEAVDLVDEQDVAVFEIGQQSGKVAGLGDDRAGGGAEADAHLAREDASQRRLAEAGRAVQQDMVERFAAALGGGDEHPQILARRLLADELVETLRAKCLVDVFGGALWRCDAGGIRGHPAG